MDTKLLIPLDSIRIAAPCDAPLDEMEEIDGDRVHFCGKCRKNVYNLSALTREEAEALINKHEGNLCVKYFQRPDGTILTADCPVGLEALMVDPRCNAPRASDDELAAMRNAMAVYGQIRDDSAGELGMFAMSALLGAALLAPFIGAIFTAKFPFTVACTYLLFVAVLVSVVAWCCRKDGQQSIIFSSALTVLLTMPGALFDLWRWWVGRP